MCVLGLGLIGGSIMRATAAAGREVFGYNRSVEGAHGAGPKDSTPAPIFPRR
ncbi:prephenate dehydrogenase domain protein [Mycobacterium kansasii 824]|nr:prephenate dehydrogenase domain protein [Mycobacterium kansasii 824]